MRNWIKNTVYHSDAEAMWTTGWEARIIGTELNYMHTEMRITRMENMNACSDHWFCKCVYSRIRISTFTRMMSIRYTWIVQIFNLRRSTTMCRCFTVNKHDKIFSQVQWWPKSKIAFGYFTFIRLRRCQVGKRSYKNLVYFLFHPNVMQFAAFSYTNCLMLPVLLQSFRLYSLWSSWHLPIRYFTGPPIRQFFDLQPKLLSFMFNWFR